MNLKHLLITASLFVFTGSLIAQEAPAEDTKASKKEAKAAEKAAKEAEKAAKTEGAAAETAAPADTAAKAKRVRPPFVSSKWPAISVGAGNMSFMGDIADNTSLFTYTNWRMGYNFRIEHRTWSALGFAINGLYGKVTENERSPVRNLNFESTIMQAEFDIMIYLDNNLFINRASRFSPYLFGGVGYMMFTPKTNLTNEDGKAYYYWDDGTIRTEEKNENTIGHITPGTPEYNITQIDDSYETAIDSSFNSPRKTFDKSALTIPFGGGLRYKLSDKFDVCASATYYLTLTDYLDALEGKNGLGGNDGFIYTSLSFAWNIGIGTPKAGPSIYDEIDFDALDNEDDDGDGIKNNDDWCAGTPSGVTVDANGCPYDNDKDGVADYKDDEPNSALGAIVDAKGVTIGEDSYDDLGADTVGTPRNLVFESHPKSKPERVGNYFSFEKPQAASGASNISEYAAVDIDGDGFISAQEITNAIDMFFDGELDYSATKLHSLIDFFFDQE
jgi:opacity protein-like surface antigen